MDAAVASSIAIAALSLLVAAGALIYARRADARAERADQRAEQADQRAEQADQRAERADQRAQEAHISANYLGYKDLDGTEYQPIDPADLKDWDELFAEPDPGRPRSTGEFRFRLINVGRDGARHILLRLTDTTGRPVGAPEQQPLSLAAGDSGEYVIKVAEPVESYAYPLQVRMSWDPSSGGPGERNHVSKQEVPRPRGL